MNNIVIKSIAGNRVRLKSDIFSKERNITLIKEHFESVIYNLRTNKQCSSIIFNHKQTLTPYDIVQQLNDLFLLSTPSKEHILSCSGGSCNSCNIKKHDPVTFRRKLFEFGALTIYVAYLFVSETFLGIAVATTPFSLLAGVALIAAIPLLKESFEDIKNKKFTLQTFMGTTLVGTIFFGEVMAAFEIIYILRGGMLLEEYIANKSKDEIHRLVELDIKKVFILEDSYELEIDLDDLQQIIL
ncbi:MAG: hypothetical protein GX118_03030 [Arcobacter butzleri]|nr:hypothetical protein [Aliarcobacter butzleri]